MKNNNISKKMAAFGCTMKEAADSMAKVSPAMLEVWCQIMKIDLSDPALDAEKFRKLSNVGIKRIRGHRNGKKKFRTWLTTHIHSN